MGGVGCEYWVSGVGCEYWVVYCLCGVVVCYGECCLGEGVGVSFGEGVGVCCLVRVCFVCVVWWCVGVLCCVFPGKGGSLIAWSACRCETCRSRGDFLPMRYKFGGFDLFEFAVCRIQRSPVTYWKGVVGN